MESRHVEHLIIGFGKAGKTLAARIAKEGGHVTLVERDRNMYGGTCINIGCLPSKSLILDAYAAGRQGAEPRQAFAEAMAAKTALASKLRAANYRKLDVLDGVTVLDGTARFTGAHTVLVDGADGVQTVLEADRIYIDTGAKPRIPDVEGIRTTPGVYDSTAACIPQTRGDSGRRVHWSGIRVDACRLRFRGACAPAQQSRTAT